MFINAQHLSYHTPKGNLLFNNINFSLSKGEKVAIVGNNGVGKSTLLRMMAGQEKQYSGSLQVTAPLYYVPQHYGHFNEQTVAEALGIAPLLEALKAIENGSTNQRYYDLLEHHWDITARCEEAFAQWDLSGISLEQPLQQLSGGMKTRLFLSGINMFGPAIVLLDEPTNHLDKKARLQLYHWIEHTNATLLLTSHDRQLLRLCAPIWELQAGGIKVYGGNYDFYEEQKSIASAAVAHQLLHQEKTLKEAKLKQQQAHERKQRADAQARKTAAKSGGPKILLNTQKNSAQNSGARLKQVHEEKVNELRESLKETATMAQVQRIMKGYFETPPMPQGKVLVQATGVNYAYPGGQVLWQQPLTITIKSGNRLAVSGSNGSGKSTLFKLLQGKMQPSQGTINIAPCTSLLLDQDYSIINRGKTVLEQALSFNNGRLEAAMVHTLLANFLFMPESWNKPAAVLSGGEMLRLALCCMVLQNKTPDIIFLDEPVNNLDLGNIRMLAKIFSEYRGTLIVISHDAGFLEEAGIFDELLL